MSHSPDHSAASSLFCAEDPGDVVSSDADTSIHDHHHHPSSLHWLPHTPPYDDITIAGLIKIEPDHMPHRDYLHRCRHRSIDVTARQDSINWILKEYCILHVHTYYHFKPVTALLSVNYFDRFLSSITLPQPNGWPFQLLSVACLSLAAKMEEPEIPLLLDFQVYESKFVFEPRTIQRMELWVMSNLDWRLRSVTPFDFLDHFVSKLPSSSTINIHELFSASSDLILSTTRVIDFLDFTPSTIAAAAVLCAAGKSLDSPAMYGESVNEEIVISCHQLMEEYLIDTCPAEVLKGRRAESAPPPSPVGVLDAAACISCDTRSENPDSSNQGEPPTKRLRSHVPDVQQR